MCSRVQGGHLNNFKLPPLARFLNILWVRHRLVSPIYFAPMKNRTFWIMSPLAALWPCRYEHKYVCGPCLYPWGQWHVGASFSIFSSVMKFSFPTDQQVDLLHFQLLSFQLYIGWISIFEETVTVCYYALEMTLTVVFIANRNLFKFHLQYIYFFHGSSLLHVLLHDTTRLYGKKQTEIIPNFFVQVFEVIHSK